MDAGVPRTFLECISISVDDVLFLIGVNKKINIRNVRNNPSALLQITCMVQFRLAVFQKLLSENRILLDIIQKFRNS